METEEILVTETGIPWLQKNLSRATLLAHVWSCPGHENTR